MIKNTRLGAKNKNQQSKVEVQPSIYQPNILTRQIQLGSLVGFKCTHITFFLCWFGLILSGTTIIGYGSMNVSKQFDFCADSEPFCFYDITLDSQRDLYLYAKLTNFHQNNRLYLDAYSFDQLNGKNGSAKQCGNYKTYKSLSKSLTVGGYRVSQDFNVHPCGYPMLSLYNDQFSFIYSDGGMPITDNDIISNFSLNHRFTRLPQYSRTQWTDVKDSLFVNWFTIGMTSTKYVLMAKLKNLTAGEYRLIVKNNFPTKGQFVKKAFYSETNNLGITNHLLGFATFAYGIVVLLVHLGICCKSKD